MYNLVQRILSNRHIDLSDFSSAALSSIVVATATPHSSALQMKKSSCVNIAENLIFRCTTQKKFRKVVGYEYERKSSGKRQMEFLAGV